MENINLFKIMNGVVRELRYEMVPEHQLQKLTGAEAEEMIRKLVKPIKFRCVHATAGAI